MQYLNIYCGATARRFKCSTAQLRAIKEENQHFQLQVYRATFITACIIIQGWGFKRAKNKAHATVKADVRYCNGNKNKDFSVQSLRQWAVFCSALKYEEATCISDMKMWSEGFHLQSTHPGPTRS